MPETCGAVHCPQDYADLLQTHRSSNADITIATHAVGPGQASFRGCCKVEPDTGTLLVHMACLAASMQRSYTPVDHL